MADEQTTPSAGDDLLSFAHSFTAEDSGGPETPATETPATETPATETPKEETPPTETKETPKPEDKPVEEDENPFKTDGETKEPAKAEEKEPEKPTSKDDWSRLRESRDKHKAAAEEREALLREKEAEVVELKQKAARTTELEDKLRLFEEQEKELALARVESTLEYKENILAPLETLAKSAEILTTSNEGDVEAVKRMLEEPDPAKQRAMLKDLTAGWDEIDRLDLKRAAEDARILLDKQDAMRQNAHATAKEQKELAAKKESEARETARKEFAKATTDVVKSLRDKVPFVALSEGETEDDRYSSLEQKVAQVDLDKQDARAKALAVASALALPQAIKTIGLKDAEIASLKEALAKATSGKPSLTPTPESPDAQDEGDFFKNMGIPEPKMFGSMSL